MLISLTKNITRVIFWLLIFITTIVAAYILGGYKYYSILKNNESIIVSQVKERLDVNLKYSNIDETWKNLLPGVKIENVVMSDKKGNTLEAKSIDVKFDLIAFLFEKKIQFKNIYVDNVKVNYNQPEQIGVENHNSFDWSILKTVNIDELKFNDFSLTYNTPEKSYVFNNLSLIYKDVHSYVLMKYNGLNIYQYIDKKLEKSRTVIRGDMKDIENTIISFDGKQYLDFAQYNKIFNVEGKVRIEANVSKIKDIWDYEVIVNLPDNTVNLLKEKLKFSNFKGNITYSKDKGLITDNMTCVINGKDCKFSISNNGMNDVRYNFEAYADKSLIDKYTPFFASNVLTGGSYVKGVYYSRSKSADLLSLSTDLVGVKISNLPILNKDSSTPYQLKIDNTFSDKAEYVEVSGNGLQVFVDFKKNQNTQIYLNTSDKKFIPIQENLLLQGNVTEQDVNTVLQFIDTLNFNNSNKKDTKSTKDFVYTLDLNGKNITYLGKTFDNITLKNKSNSLFIDIDDADFKGLVEYNLSTNTLNGRFDKFYYIINEGKEENVVNNTITLRDIPNMNMVVRDIKIKSYSGELAFNGRHVDNGYVIDNIQGAINGLSPTFIFNIKKDNNGLETNLVSINDNKLIEFKDIGDILSHYGYSNTMTSKSGVVKGNLSWSGLVPSMKSLNGKIDFELIDGRINAASAGQKVLNIFRIFEVNTLNQLFRLDFDIMKSGIQYDSLIGGGEFINGTYEIDKKKPINMKSKSFNAALSGSIDFEKEMFNNRIQVDLPISQKLPAIALIAGGPAAAAGIWVVDKIVGDKLNSLMSVGFTIKGSFAAPTVNNK